jgi:hypothetical protein
LFEPKSKEEEKMAQMFLGIMLWGLTRLSHKYLPIQNRKKTKRQRDKQTNRQKQTIQNKHTKH